MQKHTRNDYWRANHNSIQCKIFLYGNRETTKKRKCGKKTIADLRISAVDQRFPEVQLHRFIFINCRRPTTYHNSTPNDYTLCKHIVVKRNLQLFPVEYTLNFTRYFSLTKNVLKLIIKAMKICSLHFHQCS